MNNENAVKQIETSLKELSRFKRFESEIGFSDSQALNKFKKLVERATPKKPYIKKNSFDYYCPNCDILALSWKCCPNCGQALDWSK